MSHRSHRRSSLRALSCPHLDSQVKTTLWKGRLTLTPEDHDNYGHLTTSVIIPLTVGMQQFITQDYLPCAKTLSSVMNVTTQLDGTIVDTSVFHWTHIEALLRANQWIEARDVLLPRAVLTPNEAQTWRRLAGVFGHLQQESLSRMANYTAWQLGIGQGGFGGPT